MDKEIAKGLRTALENRSRMVMVTVVNTIGSTPRKVGSRMLVAADGSTYGTIGGGCGEAEARREALNVLACGQSCKYCLNMNVDLAEEEGMVCGGRMDLFLDYLDFEHNSDVTKFMAEYLSQIENYKEPILVTLLESNDKSLVGGKNLYNKRRESIGYSSLTFLDELVESNPIICSDKSLPYIVNLKADGSLCTEPKEKGTIQLFIEPPGTDVDLVILGGGHIALPLATMAKILGYHVTVIDDRPTFANPVRFYMADKVICNDFNIALKDLKLSASSYVVIVTRGHRHDKVCLREVIQQPAGYIGMIGSRRRVSALVSQLAEEGVPSECLERLYSPIGLKIGAETPEEIAVCILGEVIKVNKGV